MSRILLLPALLAAVCAASPPLDSPASLPEWARTGRFRATRWDGGTIEAEKAVISGWPGFSRDDANGTMAATRAWYDPRTVEFLKTAHFNWAWLTWSVGFSDETERPHWEQTRRYIAECHRNGIKVTAYFSIANIFWQDMFQFVPAAIEWVQRMPGGSPRYYGGLRARYMANLADPRWTEYLRTRVRTALEAGVDGFWLDNTFESCGEENVRRVLAMVHEESGKAGRRIVVNSNYNRGIYTWARFQNGVTTEDGDEPGYYPGAPEGKRFITNAGLLRYHWGIAEGWRPVSIEYGGRHEGHRMTNGMAPAKWQLALAECAAFHTSLEPYFEGRLVRDLTNGEAGALEQLKAIGAYNRFLDENGDYLADFESMAPLAVLADATDAHTAMLNAFAAANLQHDVLFHYQEPSASRLSRYKALLLPATNPVSNRLLAALSQYVRSGGTILFSADASLFPAAGERRAGAGLLSALRLDPDRLLRQSIDTRVGSGRVVYYPQTPAAAELISTLKSIAGDVSIQAPPTVLFNAVKQPARKRIVVHLLNYAQNRLGGIRLAVAAKVTKADVRSPDFHGSETASVERRGGISWITVPRLLTYNVVSLSFD